MIQANTNTYTVVEQRLDPPVLATKIRIVPYSEHVRTVCMRIELVGYRWQGKYHSFLYPHVYSDWALGRSRGSIPGNEICP
jgi:discoidin domain receptor family protein 2